MNKTAIQWTDYTTQLVRFRSLATGRTLNWCQKVSPGCAGCYAERITRRFHGTAHSYTPAGRELVEPFLDGEALRELATTRRKGRVFVEDMSDLFGEWVPNEWIAACFDAFARSRMTIQVLTKRAARMQEFCSWALDNGLNPLPNVWLGVSVENRNQRGRLDHLRRTPAAVRFASFEPLLEDLGDLAPWLIGECLDCLGTGDGEGAPCEECSGSGWRTRIDWAIFGGESGSQARSCDVAWIRSGVRQCRDAGVAPFVKQLGSWPVIGTTDPRMCTCVGGCNGRASLGMGWGCALEKGRLNIRDSHGGDMSDWPEDLRVREMPEVTHG